MASIQAFVAIVEEFISDLNKSFPEDEKIADYKNGLRNRKNQMLSPFWMIYRIQPTMKLEK